MLCRLGSDSEIDTETFSSMGVAGWRGVEDRKTTPSSCLRVTKAGIAEDAQLEARLSTRPFQVLGDVTIHAVEVDPVGFKVELLRDAHTLEA